MTADGKPTEFIQLSTTPAEEKGFERVNRLLALIRDADHRSLVLVCSSYSEECLGRLLLAFMRNVKTAKELIEGFNAPLGSFSARTKAAHALGLLSTGQLRDLEHLRRIRNVFAHSWDHVSLDAPALAGHVRAMRPHRFSFLQPQETVAWHLQQSITCTLIEMETLIEKLSTSSDGRCSLRAFGIEAIVPEPPEGADQLPS